MLSKLLQFYLTSQKILSVLCVLRWQKNEKIAYFVDFFLILHISYRDTDSPAFWLRHRDKR